MVQRSRRAGMPLYALLAANTISWHGNTITQLVIPWFVLHTTGSPTLTGVVALSGQLGSLISLTLDIPLVDRLGYKRTSLIADLGNALSVALIPMLSLTGLLSIWSLAVLAFAGALFDAPGQTARASLLPDLSRRAGIRLEHANTVSEVFESGAQWTGPLLAGVLVAWIGTHQVLWADAGTFLVSVLLIGLLVPTASLSSADGPAGDTNLWAGWRFLLSDPPLRAIFLASSIMSSSMAALFTVILPVLTRTISGSATALGALVAAFGAGSVLGAVIFGRFGTRWSQRRTFIVGIWGLWGMFAALAVTPSLLLAVTVCFLSGLVAGPNGPLIPTIVVERTPAELRARVFAAASVSGLVFAPFGVLLVGFGIERLGISVTLGIVAILFAATVVGVMLDRSWRRVDRLERKVKR